MLSRSIHMLNIKRLGPTGTNTSPQPIQTLQDLTPVSLVHILGLVGSLCAKFCDNQVIQYWKAVMRQKPF